MAVTFTNVSNYLSRTTCPSVTTLSLCGWFRTPASINSYHYPLVIVDDSTHYGIYVGFLELGQVSGHMFVRDYTSGTDLFVDMTKTAATNTWYWIAMTRQAGTNNCKGYIALASEATLTTGQGTPGTATTTPDWMGMGNDAWGDDCPATVAALKIWSGVVLSQAELEQERWYYTPQRKTDLWLWSPFNDQSDANFRDYSGNARDWTETGSCTQAGVDGPPISWAPPRRRRYFLPLNRPIFDENFEGTGDEEAWGTPTVGAGCTYNVDAAIPGTPPATAGSQCLNIVRASGAAVNCILDLGASSTPELVFLRIYVYFTAMSCGSAAGHNFTGMSENSNIDSYNGGAFGFYNTGSVYQWRFGVRTTSAWSYIYSGTLSLNTWYCLEGKWDNNGSGSHQFWVDGVSQGTLTGNIATDRWPPRYFLLGSTGTYTETYTAYLDLFKGDIAKQIGQEPAGSPPSVGGVHILGNGVFHILGGSLVR